MCTLLHNLGFAFQRPVLSDHLDAAKRLRGGRTHGGDLRAAKRRKGLILCEDEASFAQWGR
jgi:hypothetical protein